MENILLIALIVIFVISSIAASLAIRIAIKNYRMRKKMEYALCWIFEHNEIEVTNDMPDILFSKKDIWLFEKK